MHGIVGLAADTGRAGEWIDFKETTGAFSLKMPVQPEKMDQEVPNPSYPESPFLMHLFVAADEIKKVNYMVSYNDYPAGMFLANKSLVFSALTKQFESKGKVMVAAKPIFKDGYEGRSAELIVEGNYMEIHMYVRGNRSYLLLRQNMNGQESVKNDPFFDSFRFEKYDPYKGVLFSLENTEVMMPAEPILVPEAGDQNASFLKDSKSYVAVNKNSGGVYSIQQAKISKYFRSKNPDSLLNIFLKRLKPGSDTVYKSGDVLVGNAKGKQFYSSDTVAGTNKRVRVWLKNDHFYYQLAILSKEEVADQRTDDYFNSVKHQEMGKAFNLTSSKAALIMQDLKSKDTLVHHQALDALAFYDFSKEELPAIYAALNYSYADDTSTTGTRTLLIRQLSALPDAHTVPFLKALYKSIKNPDVVKARILYEVADLDKNSYDWCLNCVADNPPLKLKSYRSLFSPLTDSISYTARHLDKLVALLNVKEYRPSVLGLLSEMLTEKDKPEYLTLVESKKEQISANVLKDLDQYIVDLGKGTETNTLSLYHYLEILPKIHLTKLTDEFTNKLFAVDSIEALHTAALSARIGANLALDPKMLSARLDSLNTRYDIMNAFYTAGKLENVPLKYRKHDEFAKLLLYNYLAEDNDYPESIRLLGDVTEGEKTYYAYEFSYMEGGERKNYIGLCGPFDSKTDQLNFEGYTSFTDYELRKSDWIAQTKSMIIKMKEDD